MVQEAEEQLDEGQVGFIPEASAMTHKQVLEMAVAEASRRVREATKYAHSTPLVHIEALHSLGFTNLGCTSCYQSCSASFQNSLVTGFSLW
jgi:hypothetical protein